MNSVSRLLSVIIFSTPLLFSGCSSRHASGNDAETSGTPTQQQEDTISENDHGYRDDNYFHFNWGWGGQQNGYYALTNCSSYGFNSNHAIIIGIRGPELPQAIGENSERKVMAYPNPTSGIVHVQTEGQSMVEVQVFDLFGKMLLQQSIGETEFSVDLSN